MIIYGNKAHEYPASFLAIYILHYNIVPKK